MTALKIKQGETFILDGAYFENDKVTPKSLAGVELKSQLRDKNDKLIADLTIIVTDEPNGLYQITVEDGTLTWPAGTLLYDIKQTVNGVTRLSDTYSLVVEKSQTRV